MRFKPLSLVVAALVAVLLLATPASADPHGDKPSGSSAAAPEAASPEAVVLNGLTQVQAGYNLSCARTGSGQVRCWGQNDEGELGNGNTNPHQYAVGVKNVAGTGPLSNVTQVAVGDNHACALLTNHEVRCWGNNGDGQLGNGNGPADSSLPVIVKNASGGGHLVNVRQISAESDGTCARLSNGQLRCWGDNDYGQLGDGNGPTDSSLPRTVRAVGGGGALTNVVQVEAAYDNNCARLANGQARCWGYNSSGELGNGGTTDSDTPVVVKNVAGNGPLTNVTDIAAGGYQGCARLSTGQARCWGENDDGEVGDGTLTERDLPVVVKNASGTGPLVNVGSVTGGYDHSCALLTNGQARCWGATDNGQLGDGTSLMTSPDRPLPRPVRSISGPGNLTGIVQLHSNQSHTCALLNTGQARCWGRNNAGQLGNGGTTDANRPVKVLM